VSHQQVHFTVRLHVMRRMLLRYGLSVRLSNACVVTKRKNVCPHSYTTWKNVYPSFQLGQLIRSWLITFLTLTCYVMLWSWPLTLWPWTLVLHRLSCAQTPYQIWAKSNSLRRSYGDWRRTSMSNCQHNRAMRGWVINDLVEFPASFFGVKTFKRYSSEGRGPNWAKFDKNIGQPSAHTKVYFGTDTLLRFERRAAKNKCGGKLRPNSAPGLYLTHCPPSWFWPEVYFNNCVAFGDPQHTNKSIE